MNNRTTITLQEVDEFQPIVAQWFANHGYTFEREYQLPNGGKIDFVATHTRTKKTIFVECKCRGRLSANDIAMIRHYAQSNDDFKVYVAIPRDMFTPKIRQQFNENGFIPFLIPIDYSAIQAKRELAQFYADLGRTVFNASISFFEHRGKISLTELQKLYECKIVQERVARVFRGDTPSAITQVANEILNSGFKLGNKSSLEDMIEWINTEVMGRWWILMG